MTCTGSAGVYSCIASGMNNTAIADGVVASVTVTLSGSTGANIGLASVLGSAPAGYPIAISATGGVVSVALNQPPQPVSVSPSSGTGASQTFSFLFTDVNGTSDLTDAQMIFNSSLTGVSGCYINTDPIHKLLSLASDAGNTWLGPVTVGTGSSLQNSQCTLSAASSNVVSSGNNVTVTLTLTFQPAFAGARNVWGYAQNAESQTSSWAQLGTWTVLAPASGPPSVHIDLPGPGSTVNGTVTLAGWAIDNAAQIGTAIGSVQVLVDGVAVGNATYGASRPDVCAAFPGRPGCPNVGFTYQLNLAGLSAGTHTITVSATDTDSTPDVGSVATTITVGTQVIGPPAVHIDLPAPGSSVSGTVTVAGWAIDNTSSVGSAIGSVKVLVDGVAMGTATYGVNRPDVCAAYPGRPGCPDVGYTYQLNLAGLSAGTHMITVSATDMDSTPDVGTVSTTITVSTQVTGPPSVHIDMPAPGSSVSGTVTIAGWAIDSALFVGSAISKVQVLVDGVAMGTATYGVSRPDVCAAYPGRVGCPNVGYTFALNTATLTSGSHTVTVTATDSDTNPDSGSANITVVR
jgi:hypothetical protein